MGASQEGTVGVGYERYIPAEKGLDPAWVSSLFAKGERRAYTGEELTFIGMPCGGIGAGQIEITGEGTLGTWWIFNENIPSNQGDGRGSNGHHYLHPKPIDKRVEHGFAIRFHEDGKPARVLELSRKDFDRLTFTGEYPMATLDYKKSGEELPVRIQGEVFSPFVPLCVRDSANPVTILKYAVTNGGDNPLTVALGGWLANHTFPQRYDRPFSRVHRDARRTTLLHGLHVDPAATARLPATIEWEPHDATGSNLVGEKTSPRREPETVPRGTRVTKPFRINRPYLLLTVNGAQFSKTCCVRLVVEDAVVLSDWGDGSGMTRTLTWEVSRWSGREVVLEVIDGENRGGKTTPLEHVMLADDPRDGAAPLGNGHPQFGELALSVLDPGARASAHWANPMAFLDAFGQGLEGGPREHGDGETSTGIGSVSSERTLSPGETAHFTFLVSWWFPNSRRLGWNGRIYTNWYGGASDVADYVATHFERLYRETRLFHDTYFDTTLPYWLANRITMPASTLACDNVVIFQNGRFYADEGIGFCPGTCGHVFNFATAPAKLFPELERSVRLKQDLDERFGFDPLTGRINFRGHDGPRPDVLHAWASDAQSGYVLKLYREHLNSPDDAFLASVWPKAKKVMGFQIFQDGACRGLPPDGVLKGLQTHWDPMWFGPNPYNQGLYLAALRAAEEMARHMGEEDLAHRYRDLFEKGKGFLNGPMWNGRYYVHLYPNGTGVIHSTNGILTAQQERELAANLIEAFNKGEPHAFESTACDAQQLFGQTWADQLGLGPVVPAERCREAAASIYEQNWTPDIATVYRRHPPRHRILGAFGEPGLVNGSWQTEARKSFENIHDKDDLWTGLEYQAACDMISAGLVAEGLTVVRSVNNRYDARVRNPWNEIEGSEHYVRAMHSWNLLLVLSGFRCDGPAGKIAFGPRLSPSDFKAFFSAAEGWGSFRQHLDGATCDVSIDVAWGRLRLREITLDRVGGGTRASLRLGSRSLPCRVENSEDRTRIALEPETVILAGQCLEIRLEQAR